MKKLFLATAVALFTTYSAYSQLPKPTIEPDDQSYLESFELENFILTYDEDVEIQSFNQWAEYGLTLNMMETDLYGNVFTGRVVATYKVALDPEHPNVARLEKNKFMLTETGRYVLQIPPMLFVTNYGTNENMEYYFEVVEVTGVETLSAETSHNIYSANGMKIQSTDLSTLPAGLYIIDGRKFLKP